jgi:ABC-type spermidine/putrescine transport system permease subunit II
MLNKGATTLSIKTFNITILSTKGLFETLSINYTQHIRQSVSQNSNLLSIIMLKVAFYLMLNVVMLSVVLLNVIMLSIVAP